MTELIVLSINADHARPPRSRKRPHGPATRRRRAGGRAHSQSWFSPRRPPSGTTPLPSWLAGLRSRSPAGRVWSDGIHSSRPRPVQRREQDRREAGASAHVSADDAVAGGDGGVVAHDHDGVFPVRRRAGWHAWMPARGELDRETRGRPCEVLRPSRPAAAQAAAKQRLIWSTPRPTTESLGSGVIVACRLRTAGAQSPTRRRTSARPPVGSVFERRTVTTMSPPALGGHLTAAEARAAGDPDAVPSGAGAGAGAGCDERGAAAARVSVAAAGALPERGIGGGVCAIAPRRAYPHRRSAGRRVPVAARVAGGV